MLPDRSIFFSPDGGAGGGATQEAPQFAELPKSLQAAFGGLVDYAGFAPPAETNPVLVVSNYADYRKSPHKQMVNRLVQRAVYNAKETQLDTSDFLVLQIDQKKIPAGEIWPVSALFLTDPLVAQQSREQTKRFKYGERQLSVFSQLLDGKIVVDSIEMPAQSVKSVEYIVNRFATDNRHVYIEVPVETPQTEAILDAIAQHKDKGVFAKLRTGGPKPPSFEQTADFMIKAAQLEVGYKFTGRLHGLVAHTVTEKKGEGGVEIEESGYLNAVVASALSRLAANGEIVSALVAQVLAEKDINAFTITSEGISWNGQFISTELIEETRKKSLHSIGSCSFEEPVDELKKIPKTA